jgi:hypothetical protein
MSLTVANWIVVALGVYAGIGIVFAILFVAVGAARIDPTARAGTTGFRILILPGAAAFWPLLLTRWIRGEGKPPEERTPHRKAAAGRGEAS